MENQLSFNLLELDLDDNLSLDKKIENIADYLNQNINSQFNFDNKVKGVDNKKQGKNLCGDEITNVNYEKAANLHLSNKYLEGFLDFNEYILVFYSSDSIIFKSKKNYETIFIPKENDLESIIICKKINDEIILVLTNKHIIFLKIIDNNDYIITKKIQFSNKDIHSLDFYPNLDLLYMSYKYQKEYSEYPIGFSIEMYLFPDYNKKKFSIYNENANKYKNDKIQCNKDNSIFFHLSSGYIGSYRIKKDKCYLENCINIDFDENASLLDLNNDFYWITYYNKILLINKNNFFHAKTIEIDSDSSSNRENLGTLQISDKILTLFYDRFEKFKYINFDISSDGIKWRIKKKENLLDGNITKICHSNNYLFCIRRKNSYENKSIGYFLFKINK